MNLNHWDGAESANPEIQNDEKKGKRERERERVREKKRERGRERAEQSCCN